MQLNEAQNILARALAPLSYDSFFNDILGRKPLALLGNPKPESRMLLGDDPKKAILAAYEKYAPQLTCHIRTPNAPPPMPRSVADPGAFMDLITEYHERGYTVRIPEVTNIAPPLDQFTRALEVIVGNPVGVVVFWSADEAEAPVHDDEVDVIIVQLLGTKKWFVSDDPPKLPNKWKPLGASPVSLDRYTTYDVRPGDILYLPRGTTHTVQSTAESIHLAIGFVPVTVREAISATLDYLSDLAMPLRAGLGKRADSLATGQDMGLMMQQIRAGLDALQKQCQSEPFVQRALAHRRARMIQDLPKLPPAAARGPVTVDSRVRQSALAIAQLTVLPDILDFTQPGDKLLVHPGVEACMRYIVATLAFRVGDIPGDVGDDIRLALVTRLLGSGFLIMAD